MDIWQRLGLQETNDLAAIKRAYHIKLRDCHPEDDPEGFRLLREAYEEASRPRPAMSDASKPQTELVRPADAAELTALLELLGDASRRFVMTEWDKWQTSLQSLSLVQQSRLSDEVLQHIFQWQWLPAPVIERLWQALDWASLLRLTGDMQKKGEFLDWWRQAPLAAPLEWLATLDHARQRAVLAFYQPLLLSLEAGDRNSVLGLIYHSALPIVGDHPDLLRLQLRALHAAGTDDDPTHRLALTLALLEQDHLSEDDWHLLSDASLRCGKEQLVMQVAEALEEREYEALLANHLIQWHLDSDQDLSRWLQAFATAQKWPTSRSAYWEPQWLMLPWQQPDPVEEWLHDQMLGFDNMPLTALALDALPGTRGALASLWWHSEYGTWQALEAALTQPELAEAEGGWRYLAHLLQRHARRKLAERPALPLLDTLLARYGNDDWLSIAPPSAEQIACATPEQWLDCLRRYPLLPDSWFKAIAQRASNEGWDERMMLGMHLGARLSHQRYYSDMVLSDAWHGESWPGCFRWAQFYYAYAWTPTQHLAALRHAMGVLPPSQDDTPLATVLRLSAQPTVYQAAITTACARWPEQYVLSVTLSNQTDLLRNSEVSDQSLLDRARAHELPALAALIGRRLDNEPDLASSIVLWNLLLCHPESNAAYAYLLSPLRRRMEAIRKEWNLDLANYPYHKESLIYGYLIQDTDTITAPTILEQHLPCENAATFVHPSCYCLGLLTHDVNRSGFNSRLIQPLLRDQESLSPPQREAASLTLGYLEDKLNQQLEHDRAHDRSRFKQLGKGALLFTMLIGLLQLFMVFPLSDHPFSILGDPYMAWKTERGSLIALYSVLFLNVYLIYQVTRGTKRRPVLQLYWLWSAMWFSILFLSNSAFWGLPIWLGHLLAISGVKAGELRHGWPKAFYAKGRMSLEEIIG
ncbi:J domain-containing protein [Aeromonas veronii]|uniref:J domain-containing protein n=1 Tax=Aeromonas veronii TaxID=654 RepID=UPI00191D5A11|nr:J domain-containing protein [Aeromonas veronii]MBL0642785.1 J domain-containing protein [Aeromonas veronii]